MRRFLTNLDFEQQLAGRPSANAPHHRQDWTQIWLPFPKSKDPAGVLEKAALNCPVHHSLHPAVERPVTFHWAD